jgi:hypothetical protein
MTIGSQITILRTALQHALDELHRVNASHACVRPDVTHAAMIALHETFIPEIEHASEVERRIVGKLVQDALAGGYDLSVWDGGEMTVVESHDPDEIYKALATTDSDTLYIHIRDKNPPGVMLVWGNDCSVISDYNTSLEALIAGANALADELEG